MADQYTYINLENNGGHKKNIDTLGTNLDIFIQPVASGLDIMAVC